MIPEHGPFSERPRTGAKCCAGPAPPPCQQVAARPRSGGALGPQTLQQDGSLLTLVPSAVPPVDWSRVERVRVAGAEAVVPSLLGYSY